MRPSMPGTRPRRAAAVLGLLLACSGCGALAEAPRALVGGLLIDGSGGPPVPDSVIIINGDRIVAVGQSGTLPLPEGAEVVSTAGLTVLPGLWDLGVHLSRLGHANDRRWDEEYVPLAERVVMPLAARQLLLAGVTGVRDRGAPLAAAVSLRSRIRAARLPGPDPYVCGPVLEKRSPAGAREYRWPVDGPKDAQQRVARLASAGVDCVVIAGVADFSDAELHALVSGAQEAGIPWYAEVRHDADIAPALASGAVGLIGFGTDLTPTLAEDALGALRSRAARGDPVRWATGLSALTNYEWLLRNPTPLDEPRWHDGFPEIVAADIRESLRHPAEPLYETPALRSAVLATRLASAREAGARFVVGSDAGLPGHIGARATWQEVELLVLAGGLTPMDAIRAATIESAAAVGADGETGSIVPGKLADVIAVRGDVLRHIERLQDVEIVIRHGLRYR